MEFARFIDALGGTQKHNCTRKTAATLVGRLPLAAIFTQAWHFTPAAPGLGRSTVGINLGPPVFPQPWHDFNEVAGAVAVVELPLEDATPGVLASPGRAGQAEDVGVAC